MTIASINPATGELLRTFRALDDREIDAALARAAGAFRVNSARGFRDRAQRMIRAAELLESRAKDYGRTMTLEMGKPIGAAVAEVKKCALVCRYYAENAEAHLADEHIATSAAESYVRYEPLGPVLAVMPWNFPFWQVFRAVPPALMAGNGMLLKHASNVPGCALAIEEVLHEAGAPKDLFRTLLLPSHSRLRASSRAASTSDGFAALRSRAT